MDKNSIFKVENDKLYHLIEPCPKCLELWMNGGTNSAYSPEDPGDSPTEAEWVLDSDLFACENVIACEMCDTLRKPVMRTLCLLPGDQVAYIPDHIITEYEQNKITLQQALDNRATEFGFVTSCSQTSVAEFVRYWHAGKLGIEYGQCSVRTDDDYLIPWASVDQKAIVDALFRISILE